MLRRDSPGPTSAAPSENAPAADLPGYSVGTGVCWKVRDGAVRRRVTVLGCAGNLFAPPSSGEQPGCHGKEGSTVRVRQRALQTALRRGSLVLRADLLTTSLMHRGSPVQGSRWAARGEALAWCGDGIRSCCARAAARASQATARTARARHRQSRRAGKPASHWSARCRAADLSGAEDDCGRA